MLMIMYFKMMEISTVYGLVKEQLFIVALAYQLDLFLLFSPLPYCIPCSYSLSKQMRYDKAAVRPSPLDPSNLAIPLVLALDQDVQKYY